MSFSSNRCAFPTIVSFAVRFPACGSIANRSAHDSNTSLVSFWPLFTAGLNRFLAHQHFFCIDRIVETAKKETGFQSVVPHFKPSAFAANRAAASTRMESLFNRGFRIPGAFRSSNGVGGIVTGVATLLTLALPKPVYYRPDKLTGQILVECRAARRLIRVARRSIRLFAR